MEKTKEIQASKKAGTGSGGVSAEFPTSVIELGSAFAARLDARIRETGQSNVALARACRCSESTIRGWRKGRTTPTLIQFFALADAAGVAPEWLAVGCGEKRPGVARNGEQAAPGHDLVQGGRRPERLLEGSPQRAIGMLRHIFSAMEIENPVKEEDLFVEVVANTMLAIDSLVGQPGDEQVLTQEDYDALVRIVAKLRHPDQTGPKGGENTA